MPTGVSLFVWLPDQRAMWCIGGAGSGRLPKGPEGPRRAGPAARAMGRWAEAMP
jgi:hypothetical protein